MSLSFEKKSKKSYVQFTTRFEEDIMQQIRKISMSINEIINQSVRYALENRK